MPTTLAAEQITAKQLIKSVKETYKKLDAFSADGTVLSEFGGEKPFKMESPFKIILRKPNTYLITWEDFHPYFQTSYGNSAIWNDGDGAYSYSSVTNTWNKSRSDSSSFATSAGVSATLSSDIPKLFYAMDDVALSSFSIDTLRNRKIMESVKIDGTDCFVLTGDAIVSKEIKIWIDKKTYLIRKVYASHEPSKDYKPETMFPSFTREEAKEILEEEGVNVTDEAITKLIKDNEEFKKEFIDLTSKHSSKNAGGGRTIFYKNINIKFSSDKNDFSFKIPHDSKEEAPFDFLTDK